MGQWFKIIGEVASSQGGSSFFLSFWHSCIYPQGILFLMDYSLILNCPTAQEHCGSQAGHRTGKWVTCLCSGYLSLHRGEALHVSPSWRLGSSSESCLQSLPHTRTPSHHTQKGCNSTDLWTHRLPACSASSGLCKAGITMASLLH